jgi:high-affinity Fe2+/Pb2+ permease
MRLITSYTYILKEGVKMGFLWGLVAGLIVGVFVGVGIMCLMISASNADDQMLGDKQYESDVR